MATIAFRVNCWLYVAFLRPTRSLILRQISVFSFLIKLAIPLAKALSLLVGGVQLVLLKIVDTISTLSTAVDLWYMTSFILQTVGSRYTIVSFAAFLDYIVKVNSEKAGIIN